MLIDDIPNTPVLNKQQIPIQICQIHKPSYNEIIFLRTEKLNEKYGTFLLLQVSASFYIIFLP